MKPEHKRPVALEDLLRLKRAERPGPEFWTQFDRELRAKQLAALVEKRPWWRDLSRTFSGVSRYGIPLGATAILTVTFLAVRETQQNVAAPFAVAAPEVVSSGTNTTVVPASHSENGVSQSISQESATPSVAGVTATNHAADQSAQYAASVASSTTHQVSLAGAAFHGGTVPDKVQSPTPYLDGKLSGASASEAMLARNLLGAVRGFETRVLPARPTVEPLQQMMTPRDARRTKMLTAMVSMAAETPVPTGERVARSLPDERLYDQIHRFSGRGDRLSVRF